MKHFIESVASILVAVTVIFGAVAAGYAMLDEDFQAASKGWVNNLVLEPLQFGLNRDVKSNINYYEKRKCQNHPISDEDHDTLVQSYVYYEDLHKAPHKFKNMTREEVCEDRKD